MPRGGTDQLAFATHQTLEEVHVVCRIGLRYRDRPSNQSYGTAGVMGVIADSEHAMRVPFMVRLTAPQAPRTRPTPRAWARQPEAPA